jgi:hypothetical protein
MLTFLLAAIGWVIFRSADIAEASAYLQRMTVGLLSFDFGTVAHGKRTLLWCLLLVVVEWVQRQRTHPLQVDGLPTYVRWTLYYLLFFVTFFARGEEQTFIYFQF